MSVDLKYTSRRVVSQGLVEIDTGDVVLHAPSGEQWLVACVRGDDLSWCGWPEGIARLSDCSLVKKATLEARLALLTELAAMGSDDHRQRHAAYVLAQEGGPR